MAKTKSTPKGESKSKGKGESKGKGKGESKGKGKGESKGKGKKKDAQEPQVFQGPPRLQQQYLDVIRPALAEKLGRSNVHALPRLQKIVCNMGVGSAIADKKNLEDAVEALTLITGQKPITTIARKSIAGFRLREGMAIGCKVTMRGRRMYEFLDRLLSLALPRVRDFRGVSAKAFDGNGNYSLGLTEYLVFPELNPDKFTRSQGLNIVVVTSADSDDEARELLKMFGMPFRDQQSSSEAA